MEIDIRIYYRDSNNHFLCFRHAVEALKNLDEEINTEVTEPCYNCPQCIICDKFV